MDADSAPHASSDDETEIDNSMLFAGHSGGDAAGHSGGDAAGGAGGMDAVTAGISAALALVPALEASAVMAAVPPPPAPTPSAARKPMLRWSISRVVTMLEAVRDDIVAAMASGGRKKTWEQIAAGLAERLPGATGMNVSGRFTQEVNDYARRVNEAAVAAAAAAAAAAPAPPLYEDGSGGARCDAMPPPPLPPPPPYVAPDPERAAADALLMQVHGRLTEYKTRVRRKSGGAMQRALSAPAAAGGGAGFGGGFAATAGAAADGGAADGGGGELWGPAELDGAPGVVMAAAAAGLGGYGAAGGSAADDGGTLPALNA
jgi:hypothetical protein